VRLARLYGWCEEMLAIMNAANAALPEKFQRR
jgi:hypothetical protein